MRARNEHPINARLGHLRGRIRRQPPRALELSSAFGKCRRQCTDPVEQFIFFAHRQVCSNGAGQSAGAGRLQGSPGARLRATTNHAPEEPKKTPWLQKRIDEVTAARDARGRAYRLFQRTSVQGTSA